MDQTPLVLTLRGRAENVQQTVHRHPHLPCLVGAMVPAATVPLHGLHPPPSLSAVPQAHVVPTLPPPKWRTCAMRWDSSHSSGWKRDLVADGDVESNPGPVPDFSSFLQHDLDEFSQAVPPMDLTRQPPHRIRYIPWNPSKILPRNTTPFSKNFPTNPCGCVISRPCF